MFEDRHPSTRHFIPLFSWEHLPPHLQEISKQCEALFIFMVDHLNDGQELSAGLRKLREAKDCFVTYSHRIAPES